MKTAGPPGATGKNDVQKFWSILVPAVRNNSSVWDTVRTHCVDESSPVSGSDAAAAWKELYNQHEGVDARQHKEAKRHRALLQKAQHYTVKRLTVMSLSIKQTV